jgi:hypothetical protein
VDRASEMKSALASLLIDGTVRDLVILERNAKTLTEASLDQRRVRFVWKIRK